MVTHQFCRPRGERSMMSTQLGGEGYRHGEVGCGSGIRRVLITACMYRSEGTA
jgi:hypothetical protein